jgi:hypothetical protein
MALTQQIRDLKFGSPGAFVVFGFNADKTQADAIGGITTGEAIHHRAQRDVSVFVLIAPKHSTFWCHHSDHFKRLAANPDLLADGIAGRKEFRS